MDMDRLVPDARDLAGFIEQFEVFASAPSGVDKLREIIFDSAIRGKLLEHKESERTLEKFGVIADHCELVMGQAPPGNECNKDGIGTVFVKTGQFGDRYPVIEEWTTKPLKYAKKNDVLICVVGATIGKLNLSIDCAIGRSVAAIRPNENLITEFLYLTLVPFTLKLRNNAKGSAQGVIGKRNLNEITLWVPSLTEQKRIVAKVDELMALCDKLEAQQQQQANNVLRANTAAINALLNPADPKASFEQNWQRIAQHFNTLYGCTLPMPKGEGRKKKYLVGLENVKKLREAILQLAVMGKLTTIRDTLTLDSNILQKILDDVNAQKKRAIAKNREAEQLFVAPEHWKWLQFEDLLLGSSAGWSPKCHGYPRENNNWGVLKVSAVTWGKFRPMENKELPANLEPRPEYEVKEGDFLLSRANTAELVARSVVVSDCESKLMMSDKVVRLNFHPQFNKPYLSIWNNSIFVRAYYISHASGTSDSMRNVTRQIMHEVPIPLPPLEEQKRIVAKVDQLMILCDQLKQQLTQSYSDAEKLMQATVKALTT